MTLTSKQKKSLWIVAGVLVTLHFAPNLLLTARRAMASRQQTAAVQKPSPRRPQAAELNQAGPPPFPVDPENAQFRRLVGDWIGGGILLNRGACHMGFQLKPLPGKPGYRGYSTLSCNPSLALLGKSASRENMAKDAINAMTPTSTIMTGEAKDGEIDFHIDKTIGTPPDGCVITGFNVMPFGEQIAVEWQAGTCPGGHMILKRVTNL